MSGTRVRAVVAATATILAMGIGIPATAFGAALPSKLVSESVSHAPVNADANYVPALGHAFLIDSKDTALSAGHQIITLHDSDVPGTAGYVAPGLRPASNPPNTTVPYNSTYNIQYSNESGTRWIGGSTGRICAHATAYTSNGAVLYIAPSTDGGHMTEINFPQDGREYGYCWGGLTPSYVYHFYLRHANAGPAAAGTFRATRT